MKNLGIIHIEFNLELFGIWEILWFLLKTLYLMYT